MTVFFLPRAGHAAKLQYKYRLEFWIHSFGTVTRMYTSVLFAICRRLSHENHCVILEVVVERGVGSSAAAEPVLSSC